MSERQLFLLSPYRPPTSYPVSLASDEVAAWLNGYAALWHPTVLRDAKRPPIAASVYDHNDPLVNAVYVIPEGPATFLADDWSSRVGEASAKSFRSTSVRQETEANLREAFGEHWSDAPADAVRALAGIGFAYLMIDTLFDAMSHDKLLDAEGFWTDIQSAIGRLESDWREPLRAAADKLKVAREGAYSGNIHLMEWIVPNVELDRWPHALISNVSVNILASAEQLERLAADSPEQFAILKACAPHDLPASAEICVGAYRERDESILPIESQLWTMRRGREVCRQLFGTEPTIFARQRSANHPHLPSWANQFGYRHGVAVSFDGATTPTRYSTVVGWPGPDGKSMDWYTREPLKAHDVTTFFNYAYHLHQAITHDSAPTLTLLHKREPAVGYDDYLAAQELANIFGETVTLSALFANVYSGDYVGAANADEFFSDSLDDRVTNQHLPNAVSEFANHTRMRRQLDSAFVLASLHRSLTPNDVAANTELNQLAELEPDLELHHNASATLSKLATLETAIATRLAERIQVRSNANQPGYLVFNPCNFNRRVAVELANQDGPIPLTGAVKASEFANRIAKVVVEVPGLGFAWMPRGSASVTLPKSKIITANGATVRNEFFEAELDLTTGGLKAFRDARTRMNRLGQLLVFNPGSKVIASSVAVTQSGSALGEVTSEGSILSEHGEPLANFRQRIRAWMGRPVLEMQFTLSLMHRPQGYPWHAYYGARFAWRDDRAATFRGVNGTNTQSTHARPMSGDYLELRFAKERTFIFTGGLPYLQRNSNRMMDVILIPEGETETTFELLIAADREYPMQTAQGWTTPTIVVPTTKGPPHIGESGWLAATDLPSLLMTSMRPNDANAIVARFLETAGFAGAAELRFARDPQAAKLVDLMGLPLQDVAMQDGAIPLEFSASELLNVRAEW